MFEEPDDTPPSDENEEWLTRNGGLVIGILLGLFFIYFLPLWIVRKS